MAQQPEAVKAEKKSIGGELVIPIAALLFTFYYFYTIIDTPWTAQVSAFFVGTILIILVAIFLFRSVLQLRRGEVDLRLDALVAPVSFVSKRLKLLVLTIAFIVLVRWLGFTITTFLFLGSSMLLLGEGRRKMLIFWMSLIMSLGGYLLFIVAFKTRFPLGPFENLMKALF